LILSQAKTELLSTQNQSQKAKKVMDGIFSSSVFQKLKAFYTSSTLKTAS
jgi:hypothetical protein